MGFINTFSRFCCATRPEESEERRTIRPGYPSVQYGKNRVKSSRYNILTFLPINLFEQFHRPINLYFLLVMVLQFVPSVATVSPLTILLPLCLAFLITTVKEGIDDLRRHRLDKECNYRRCRIIDINTLKIKIVRSFDIQVGDLLLLSHMEVVPCDVVLLLSSDENSEVVISTESLDGETSAKKRYAVLGNMYRERPVASTTSTESIQEDIATEILLAAEFIKDAECIIDSEGPKPFLNSYSGTLKVQRSHGSEEGELLFGINAENVALCTSVLGNTRFAIGTAILTGNETRVAMTSTVPQTKWSLVDRHFNQMVILVFVLQFLLVAVFVVFSDMRQTRGHETVWYLGPFNGATTLKEQILILPLSFFSLVSPMIPLSFKVLLEASKTYLSVAIKWDLGFSGNSGAIEIHNSSLMEDLGQVEYVLTDKTGTLTCNVMTLARIVTASGNSLTPGAPHVASNVKKSLPHDESLLQLMRILLYCNTVESAIHATPNAMHIQNQMQQQSELPLLIPNPASSKSTGSVPVSAVSLPSPTFPNHSSSSIWASSSPDEVALVEGAGLLGVTLLGRTRKGAFALFDEKIESVRIVRILSFTSERRRLSVLLQVDGDSRYLLLTKGADESVLVRCLESSYDRHAVLNTLDQIGSEGLRVLVTAYRYVSQEEAEEWLAYVCKQETIPSADSRARHVAYAYECIEKELLYCGITAVVDHLQQDVPRTITQLRQGGMRVWMLTGDKSQTAKQTAIASGLVTANEKVIALTPDDVESISVRDHLEHVETQLRYALQQRQFENAEREGQVSFSWWVRSGLREFLYEFSHRISISLLCRSTSRKASRHDYQTPHMSSSIDMDCSLLACGTALKEERDYTILLSGKTLELLKDCGNQELFTDFNRVVLHASTVICSRMTPYQKSFLVQEVKKAGYVTLAIGDGGNDVSMIRCAHVGIGIKGREGSQAAAASDFVLLQFSFLSRLLLFHGHTAYQRSSVIVQQSFWKTVSLAWMQLLFNIYTNFSAVSFFDSFALTMYNSLFTVPVTFLCVMNMPLSPSVLLNNPRLYVLPQKGRYLNWLTFYGYVLRGFAHGSMIFFFAFLFFNEAGSDIMRHGYSVDRTCDFYSPFFALVTLHSCIVLLEAHSITVLHCVALLWPVVAMFLSFSFYALFWGNHSFLELLKNGSFYLQWILGVVVPLLTLSLYAGAKMFFFSDLLQLQRLVLHAFARFHKSPQSVKLAEAGELTRASSALSLLHSQDVSSEHLGVLSMPSLSSFTRLDASDDKNNRKKEKTGEEMSQDSHIPSLVTKLQHSSSILSYHS